MAKKVDSKTKDKALKKKIKKSVASGFIYIQSSFNNTIVTVTDEAGNTIAWSSSGSLGFKGTKKSTPYAAQLAATSAIEKAKAYGFSKAKVYISGVGSGRESAVRALINAKLTIEIIKDVTPISHNGCRPKKARRI